MGGAESQARPTICEFTYKQSQYESHSNLEIYLVKFQVLMAASMNMTVFWDVALCSLVETDQQDLLS
jgi:hypothetical protein